MDFVVGEQIGRGGMGTVHRAKQTDLDRDLAVKFIHANLVEDEDALNRFLREANLTAKLDHPNIVRIYSRGQDESGRPYILMELLTGESLQQRLARGTLPDTIAINIAKQILSGLAAAHAKDIIHRDLKPANIFLTANGLVKILDFGIAKALGSSQMTGVGLKIGTPEYMSPEQASGVTADKRSDLYSVGITLFEMVTGNVPFEADTPVGVMYKHVHEKVPQIPLDRSPQLRRLISSLLEKNPDDRPQTPQAAMLILSTTPSGKSKTSSELESTPKKGLFKNRRKKPRKGTKETATFSPQTQLVTGTPVRRFPKLRRAIRGIVILGLISLVGYAGYMYIVPTYGLVFDKITDAMGVANLSLRVPVGQQFRVRREQTLQLGDFSFKMLDEGVYTAKAVRPDSYQIDWTTKLEKSQFESGTFVKKFDTPKVSTSSWPNSINDKKNLGWAMSPFTLSNTKMTRGESGQTNTGTWTMSAIENMNGRRVAVIPFSNVPVGDAFLDESYVKTVTARIRSAKRQSDWTFPEGSWKTSVLTDQIDLTNGVPASVRIEQTLAKGMSLKTVTTMTPLTK